METLQQLVDQFVQKHDLEAPVGVRVLDLISEVGELAKESNTITGYGKRPFEPSDNWGHELGDITFSLLCLANSTGVDLETTLRQALARMEWRIKLQGSAGNPIEAREPLTTRLRTGLRTVLRDNDQIFWTDDQLDGFLAVHESPKRPIQFWGATCGAIDEILAREPLPDMSEERLAKYRQLRGNAEEQLGNCIRALALLQGQG